MTDDDLKDLAMELVLNHAERDSPIRAVLTARIGDRLSELEGDTEVAKLISYVAAYAGAFLGKIAKDSDLTPREILRRMATS